MPKDAEGGRDEVMKSGMVIERGMITAKPSLVSGRSVEGPDATIDEALERFASNGEERDGAVGVGRAGVGTFAFEEWEDVSAVPLGWSDSMLPAIINELGVAGNEAWGGVTEEVRREVIRTESRLKFHTTEDCGHVIGGKWGIANIVSLSW
jgi:hypothetical protein